MKLFEETFVEENGYIWPIWDNLRTSQVDHLSAVTIAFASYNSDDLVLVPMIVTFLSVLPFLLCYKHLWRSRLGFFSFLSIVCIGNEFGTTYGNEATLKYNETSI